MMFQAPWWLRQPAEFCEEFMTYVRIDENAEAMLKRVAWEIQVGHNL